MGLGLGVRVVAVREASAVRAGGLLALIEVVAGVGAGLLILTEAVAVREASALLSSSESSFVSSSS